MFDSNKSSRLQHFLRTPLSDSDTLDILINKNRWLRHDDRTETITDFFGQHAADYFSPLNPVYLHQLPSIETLDLLPVFMSRDGLLPLLWFFINNPVPPQSDSILLVDQRFAPFIPTPWRSSVSYYSFHSSRKLAGAHPVTDVYLLLTIIDEKQFSAGYLDKQLSLLKDVIRSSITKPRIHVTAFYSAISEQSLGTHQRNSRLLLESTNRIQAILNLDVSYISWQELQTANLSNCIFSDMNERAFYYSDSSVTRLFLSRGAIPLSEPAPFLKDALPFDASFNHKISITPEIEPPLPAHREITAKIADFLTSATYQKDRMTFEQRDIFSNDTEKLCPRSLEDLLDSLSIQFHTE